MFSITQKRLRQIIAEEVASVVSEMEPDHMKSLEQLPAISKAAIDFWKALNNFKEKCPPECLGSISGLDELESTLEDMAGNPGNYLLKGEKPKLESDVDNLHQPEYDQLFSSEESDDDEEESEEEEDEEDFV